jgi:hypothetical protein
MTETLLLVDSSMSRINTTCSQCIQCSIGTLCYHNLMQHQLFKTFPSLDGFTFFSVNIVCLLISALQPATTAIHR